MDAHTRTLCALAMAWSANSRSSAIILSSFSNTALNDTSFRRFRMSRAVRECPAVRPGSAVSESYRVRCIPVPAG
jgi:hypothetical protein